ncbi:uncharacterized protein LOC132558331 [Ylistrum balloti]|uniref:uncharacterized protein LOC132558331 n=1 Tax=Ylistrum balloti TaxID=509963 RepID=UPI0029058DC8|nr:uncharacterized protein LOC132558331 [Ylistrum balloti]
MHRDEGYKKGLMYVSESRVGIVDALTILLVFCYGALAIDYINEHVILYGYDQSSGDGPAGQGYGFIPPSPHNCEHLPIDTTPMNCRDFITKIPRTSSFLYFIDVMHYLLYYVDDYYFLKVELKQIPLPPVLPDQDSTRRECQTQTRRLLGYWRDYGELCWIVWAGRQNVLCAECTSEYCCREFNQTDPTHVLPPTNICKPGGHTVQKFIVFCADLYGDPYDGYFALKYTTLPSCCECKANIYTNDDDYKLDTDDDNKLDIDDDDYKLDTDHDDYMLDIDDEDYKLDTNDDDYKLDIDDTNDDYKLVTDGDDYKLDIDDDDYKLDIDDGDYKLDIDDD